MGTELNQIFTNFRDFLGTDFEQQYVLPSAEKYFSIKSFKEKIFSLSKCEENYVIMSNKYTQDKIMIWPHQWHKNERKLFIQILFCFYKRTKKLPQFMVACAVTQTNQDWRYISLIMFNKNPMFLKFQAYTILKVFRKIQWNRRYDQLILQNIKKNDQGNWKHISKIIFYKSSCQDFFSPKQIRQRWFNHINQQINKGPWTTEEDILILEHVFRKNKRWCEIFKVLNKKRTQHMIKNRFKVLTKNYQKQQSNMNWKVNELLQKIVPKQRRELQAQFKSQQKFLNNLQNKKELISRQFSQIRNKKQLIKSIKQQGRLINLKNEFTVQQQFQGDLYTKKIKSEIIQGRSSNSIIEYQCLKENNAGLYCTTIPNIQILKSQSEFWFSLIQKEFLQNPQFFIWLPITYINPCNNENPLSPL